MVKDILLIVSATLNLISAILLYKYWRKEK